MHSYLIEFRFDGPTKTISFIVDLIEEEPKVTIVEQIQGLFVVTYGRKELTIECENHSDALKSTIEQLVKQRDELLEKV
jgi:hypothetical protein